MIRWRLRWLGVLGMAAALLAGCTTGSDGLAEQAGNAPSEPVAPAADGSPEPDSSTNVAAAGEPVEFGVLVESSLAVREGPGTAFAQIGSIPAGSRIQVDCSAEGEAVRAPDGVLVPRWDRLSGPVAGYVAGAYVDTNGQDPDVPRCQFVPTSTGPADAAGVFGQVASGVVRIEVTACDGGSTGSGFLIAPDLVATVAHVVEGAAAITLRAGDSITSGEVIGLDSGSEVALIRTSEPFDGHVFEFASTPAQVGQDVLVIGYPNGDPIALTRGTISAVGRSVATSDRTLDDLIQTDASINFGNSGGPLVSTSGEVLGLADLVRTDSQGIAYAVSTRTAQPLIAAWQANPQSISPSPGCAAPTGPQDGYVEALDISGHPAGPAVLQTMRTWADGISTGDYGAAWSMYSTRFRSTESFDTFVAGNTTSYIPELLIVTVEQGSDPGVLSANIEFVSTQDPEYGYEGQSCSIWNLTYTLVDEAGWRIDRAVPFSGQGPQSC